MDSPNVTLNVLKTQFPLKYLSSEPTITSALVEDYSIMVFNIMEEKEAAKMITNGYVLHNKKKISEP